jgi:hypothetical protein
VIRRALLTVLLFACPSFAAAQAAEPSYRPNHITISLGGAMAGGYPVGDMTANLRRNATGIPPPYPLLRAESRIARVWSTDVRVGVALSRSLELEVGGLYATPRLETTISQDDELGEGAFASEQIEQYAVEVSGVYLIPNLTVASRLRPYVIAGGGYLRQLHEGRFKVETGSTMHLGAGLRYWWRGGRVNQRSLGARAEVRYVRRTGGIDFEEQARSFPRVSLLAFAGF